ncbi:hypothetical protein BVX97_02270 [bacterium E08(2017)]|nr:hypothetical protein BVX97_02270 [bacterium E08(2017)]
MPESDTFEFYASASPGTEKALCDELRELSFQSVRLNRSGIPFRGPRSEGWRACLESRIAQRIFLVISRFQASDQDELYKGVQSIDWSPYITNDHTLSISAFCAASNINHSGFAALKTKDAIIDQLRGTGTARPDIDKDDPDVRIFVYILKDKATVYLDLSGNALHRRGYRPESGEAPLRETLAAAILRMSGWDRKTPLVDPMCGSGTIAIEAAQWARNIAPGLSRSQFGFERWADFTDEDSQELRQLIGSLRSQASGTAPKIKASDIDSSVLETAASNARSAGVRLSFKERSLFDIQGDGRPGFIVTNPPYGVRLEADTDFCRKAASAFTRLHGWTVAILAGDPDLERAISTKPKTKLPLKNGDLDCHLLVYEID